MFRVIVLSYLFILGTDTHAQSVEERLSECIAESQAIVSYADAWRDSLEEIGERGRPSEFADILTSLAYEDLLSEMLDMLRSNDTPKEIIKQIENESTPITLRNELIERMIDESFAEESRFIRMADYISACADNFGGETYTLQSVIENLERELFETEARKIVLERKLQNEIYALENEIEALEKVIVGKDAVIQDLEAQNIEYESKLIELKGFDFGAYLEKLVKMGPTERNNEIYEGRFRLVKFENLSDRRCFTDLRDKGKLSSLCRNILINILEKTFILESGEDSGDG